MPEAILIEPVRSISQGDTEVVGIDYQDHLDSSELLTGTPTVAELYTSALTLANKAVSTAALEILGRTSAIAKAVQFSVTGQVSGGLYRIQITVSTDSTPARTVVRDVILRCV